MTRKTYEVSSPHIGVLPTKTPDSSFKTCLCTMLVVLVICILLFLMAFGFRTFLGSREKDNIPGASSDALRNQNKLSSTVIPNDTRIINNTTVTQKPSNISNLDTERSITTYEEQTTTGESNSTMIISRDTIAATTAQVDTNETTTPTQTPTISKLEKETETQTTTDNDLEKIQTKTEQHIITTIATQMTTESHSTSTTETVATSTKVKSKQIVSDDSSNESLVGTTPDTGTKIECNSAVCTSTAARMLASMDLTQKPCENLYEYACGGLSGYEEEGFNVFSEKVLEETGTPNFIKKFNKFYKSCLEHEDRFHYQERVDKVKDLLHTVGSYQMENEGYSQNNLTNFVADLILFGKMPFFDVEVDIDHRNNTYILKLLKPDRTSLDLDDWSTFSEEKRKCIRKIEESESKLTPNIFVLYKNMSLCQSMYSGFFDSIETTMKELGFISNLTEKEQTGQIFETKRTIELEILGTVDSIMDVSNVEEEILSKKFKSMSIEELETKFPQIKWSKLFKLISNVNKDNDMKVFLHDIEYFQTVFDVLENANTKYLNNALLVMLANSLFQNTVLPIHKHSRSKYCKEVSQKLMPDIANYIYQLNNYGEVNSTEVVREIFEKLRSRFKDSLEEIDWLDKLSKNSIIAKVDALELVFNLNNLTNEEIALENVYNNLTLDDGNYQTNFFNLIKYSRKRLLSLYGQNVTPENMYRNFVDVAKKEPFFFYTSNIVCIPHGLIKKVTKVPRYITFGQVGFSLAKIIGYSFDPIGMQYGVKLDEGALQRFKEFSDEARDTVTLSDPITFGDRKFNFRLNNALSQNERMAEKTAFRLLEDTLKDVDIEERLPWIPKNTTEFRIFLLAVAQEFCEKMSLMDFIIQAMESSILPPQFRIENIMSNSEGFLKEFNCKIGSGMIRMNSSSVFPYLNDASLDY